MTTEYRRLTPKDTRTLTLSALGGALEFYDFIVYAYFAQIISVLFFPTEGPEWLSLMKTFGIFAAGYLARPFGGIIMAHFGDLVGRKKMFTLSILLMAVPTFCIGILPTYQDIGYWAPLLLLFMRILQGMAIGGEVPGAWVFVAEHLPNRMGLACGILTSGLVMGIVFGSSVYLIITACFSEQDLNDYAWRIPFIIGGLSGFIIMRLRKMLHETPIFLEMQARKKLADVTPIKSVLTKHFGAVLISMLLTWILSAGILVVIIMSPSYLEGLKTIPKIDIAIVNLIAVILLSMSCVFHGWLVERQGIFKTYLYGGILAVVTVLLFYYSVNYFPRWFYVTYPLAGLGIGVIGAFAYVMVSIFPSTIRFSGVSFSFNVAYAVTAALTPMVMIYLQEKMNMLIPGWYVAIMFSITVLIGLYLNGALKKIFQFVEK